MNNIKESSKIVELETKFNNINLEDYIFYKNELIDSSCWKESDKINKPKYKLLVTKLNEINKLNNPITIKVSYHTSISTKTNSYYETNTTSSDINFKNKLILSIQQIFQNKKDYDKYLSALFKKGLPYNLRWLIWLGYVSANNTNISDNDTMSNDLIYHKLLNQNLNNKLSHQIKNDLHRTAPHQLYFREQIGRDSLYNVLKALALYDKDVAYCQGMNIIIANLLLISDGNEEETFYIARYIFSAEYGLKVKDFFTKGFPGLHINIYLIRKLIQLYLPSVNNKLDDICLSNEVWIFKWLQSLYLYLFDIKYAMLIWDCLFYYGMDFILKFTLNLLKKFEYKILEIDDISEFVEIFKIFKNTKNINNYEFDEIIKNSCEYELDKKLIEELKIEYYKNYNNEYFEEGSFYSNNQIEKDKEYDIVLEECIEDNFSYRMNQENIPYGYESKRSNMSNIIEFSSDTKRRYIINETIVNKGLSK